MQATDHVFIYRTSICSVNSRKILSKLVQRAIPGLSRVILAEFGCHRIFYDLCLTLMLLTGYVPRPV